MLKVLSQICESLHQFELEGRRVKGRQMIQVHSVFVSPFVLLQQISSLPFNCGVTGGRRFGNLKRCSPTEFVVGPRLNSESFCVLENKLVILSSEDKSESCFTHALSKVVFP